MLKIYLIAFIIVLSCACEVKKANIDEVQINAMEGKTNFKDSLSTDELMRLSKSEAIKKFGAPEIREEFVLCEMHGEFRVGVIYKFTEEERQSGSILIDELTWEKNENTWITAWYQVGDDKSMPKSVLAWDKDSEF